MMIESGSSRCLLLDVPRLWLVLFSARCRSWLVSIIAAVVAIGMVAAMVDLHAIPAARISSQLLLGLVRTRYAALVA
jgi:hypothetical protein